MLRLEACSTTPGWYPIFETKVQMKRPRRMFDLVVKVSCDLAGRRLQKSKLIQGRTTWSKTQMKESPEKSPGWIRVGEAWKGSLWVQWLWQCACNPIHGIFCLFKWTNFHTWGRKTRTSKNTNGTLNVYQVQSATNSLHGKNPRLSSWRRMSLFLQHSPQCLP